MILGPRLQFYEVCSGFTSSKLGTDKSSRSMISGGKRFSRSLKLRKFPPPLASFLTEVTGGLSY